MNKRSDAVAGAAAASWDRPRLTGKHLVTAAAINLVRIADWWEGKTPAKTRRSRFASLQPAMALKSKNMDSPPVSEHVSVEFKSKSYLL